jgi:hypothetical protein
MDPPHPTLSPKGARAYPFFLSPLPVGEGGVRAFLVFFISERPPTQATPVLPPEGENLGTANLPPLGEVARSPPHPALPAKAGTQTLTHHLESMIWIPAFAGNAAERVVDEHPPLPTLSPSRGGEGLRRSPPNENRR